MTAAPSEPQPPRLELVNLTKRFGSFVANDTVSLKLEPGLFTPCWARTELGKAPSSNASWDITWLMRVILLSGRVSARFEALTMLTSWESVWSTSTLRWCPP